MDHSELDHGEEVRGQLLVTGGDAPAALEPADAPFDHVPASVLPAVELGRPFAASAGDHSFDGASGKPETNTRRAVRSITGDRVGTTPASDSHGVHQSFELLGLMCLSGGDQGAQRHASSIGHKMKLRSKASAGSSQGVVGGFCFAPFLPPPAADRSARMFDPSTLKAVQSMNPSVSS